MEGTAKLAAFQAALKAKRASGFRTVDRPGPSGQPTIEWEKVAWPDGDVTAYVENTGRYADIGIPVPLDEGGNPDVKAGKALCEAVKLRLMKVRKNESWSVIVLDGTLHLAFAGAVVPRGEQAWKAEQYRLQSIADQGCKPPKGKTVPCGECEPCKASADVARRLKDKADRKAKADAKKAAKAAAAAPQASPEEASAAS